MGDWMDSLCFINDNFVMRLFQLVWYMYLSNLFGEENSFYFCYFYCGALTEMGSEFEGMEWFIFYYLTTILSFDGILRSEKNVLPIILTCFKNYKHINAWMLKYIMKSV